jgi:hypothetical protein
MWCGHRLIGTSEAHLPNCRLSYHPPWSFIRFLHVRNLRARPSIMTSELPEPTVIATTYITYLSGTETAEVQIASGEAHFWVIVGMVTTRCASLWGPTITLSPYVSLLCFFSRPQAPSAWTFCPSFISPQISMPTIPPHRRLLEAGDRAKVSDLSMRSW